MNRSHAFAIAATAVFLFGSWTALPAATVTFHANLDGLQMVPPDASPAFGDLDATLDDISGAFAVTSGNYVGLLGNSFQVFLNVGVPGANGPLIGTLTNNTPGATTGTIGGALSLTAPQIASMVADNTYVRVTSSVFPGGEIRGQLLTVPEPASLVLFGAGALGVLAFARLRRASAT